MVGGYELAKKIKELAAENKIEPISYAVHSQNEFGAKRIKFEMYHATKFWQKNKKPVDK